MSAQALLQVRAQQSGSLAYFDIFCASAILAAFRVPLVFLMRRSVADKRTHIAAGLDLAWQERDS